ncbi:nitroreductase/quinone reductase family protein [Streptomyces sp. cg40]|uniref:nitroreductase/quinone reductase family protein n=1 Tax=Streptomyces sp. cg40 TaxID=3419764 RepID=UPI003CFC6ACB
MTGPTRSPVCATLSGGGTTARRAEDHGVALIVRGRARGRMIAFPVVPVADEGKWYVVSMLGTHANWVRNGHASGGEAVIRHGRDHGVTLREVPASSRARILRAYLNAAPGARPHTPVDRTVPLEDFERIAPDYPGFHVIGLPAPETA